MDIDDQVDGVTGLHSEQASDQNTQSSERPEGNAPGAREAACDNTTGGESSKEPPRESTEVDDLTKARSEKSEQGKSNSSATMSIDNAELKNAVVQEGDKNINTKKYIKNTLKNYPPKNEKEKVSVFKLSSELPPKKPEISGSSFEELDDYFKEIKESRLILISCSDESVAEDAAYAILDQLKIPDDQKRVLDLALRDTANADLHISSFFKERADSKKELAYLIDAHDSSGQMFVSSLLGRKSTSRIIAHRLKTGKLFLLCIIDSTYIDKLQKNSKKELMFSHWQIDFLERLLKHYKCIELREEILRQREVGKWKKNEREFCEEVWECIRRNQLRDEIDSREASKDTVLPDVEFKGNNPIRDTALYVATYFPDLTPTEFAQVVKSLLSGCTTTITSTVYKQNNNGGFEPVEVQKEVALTEIWRDCADRTLKECRLEAAAKDSTKVISFSDDRQRERLKIFLEREHTFFLENQFEAVQNQGLLFHHSPKVHKRAAALALSMAASFPDDYGKDWLVKIVMNLKRQSGIEEDTSGWSDISTSEQTQGGRNGWAYIRISELLNDMLEYPQLKNTIDEFFEELMTRRLYGDVLSMVRRLRFAPGFNYFHWVKQLLNRGNKQTANLAYEHLYSHIKQTDTNIYDVLEILQSWLPEKDRDPEFYSASHKYSLRLLFEYCLETTLNFDPKSYGLWPSQYPLFVFEDADTAKRNLEILSRWLFHNGMGSALYESDAAGEQTDTQEEESAEKPVLDESDGLIAALMAEWMLLLFAPNEKSDSTIAPTKPKSHKGVASQNQPEGSHDPQIDAVGLMNLLLSGLAKNAAPYRREVLLVIWEIWRESVNEVIQSLPYIGNERKDAITRRNLLNDLIRGFKNAISEVNSARRQKLAI